MVVDYIRTLWTSIFTTPVPEEPKLFTRKLSDTDRYDIVDGRNRGVNVSDLAEEYNVSNSTIYRILKDHKAK